jgi:hypothetical protein
MQMLCIIVIPYCLGNTDKRKKSAYVQHSCNFFPKSFWSVVGWINWCRTEGYTGLTGCKKCFFLEHYLEYWKSEGNVNTECITEQLGYF